jgi:hypothetical protein
MNLPKNNESIEKGTTSNIDTSMLEAALIERTKLAISPETWRLFDKLKKKFQKRTITEAELETFQKINDMLEEANIDRLEAVIELAKIRGVSFKVILQEFSNPRR